MTDGTMNEASSLTALQQVLGIRLVMLALCALALLAGSLLLNLPLPLLPLLLVIVSAFLATASYGIWLRTAQREPGSRAVFVQLLLDISLLSAILYGSGGWTNPLVSLYLVPVAIAATLLSKRLTWTIAIVCTLAYGLLTQYHQPLFNLHHGGADFALHVTGMWLTFVLAAALMAYFGTRFAEGIRARNDALAQAREDNLRNEQIIGVATLAAGTAHELSTPLTTIAVIAAELEDAERSHPEDIAELNRQVSVCREILHRLRASTELHSELIRCGDFLAACRERFTLLRPSTPLQCHFAPDASNQLISVDTTLTQALINLLDNAANASPDGIAMTAQTDGNTLIVTIADSGPGFTNRQSSGGLGLGLVLSNATIERRGGLVTTDKRAEGGLLVQVSLPLENA